MRFSLVARGLTAICGKMEIPVIADSVTYEVISLKVATLRVVPRRLPPDRSGPRWYRQ